MRHYRKFRITLVALGASLLIGALNVSHTFASFTTCRTDPIVTLSNGHTLTLWADISTDITNVSQVKYVLHIPYGQRVTAVTYDQYAYLEQFTWVADQGEDRYRINTTVLTSALAPNIPFTASTSDAGRTYTSSSVLSSQTALVSWEQ